jgi:hypothetical protein
MIARASQDIFLIIFLILIASCATMDTRKQYFKSYAINVKQQVNIGSSMLTFENITFVEGKRWVGLLYSKDGWQYFKYATDDSFKEELIYTGRSGNTAHVSYREYKKEFARPAFYQELRYDLEKSDIIVFRNYRIKVLDANNEFIKFIVLTD